MRDIFIFILCITSLKLFSQDNYPANNKIGSLEKNVLFNAQGRYMVNQTGAASLSLDMIFDGKLYPSYTTLGIPTGDSTVITIEGLPGDHVQRGAWIGWTTRYWGPSKFKIEVYNIWSGSAQYPAPNQWHTIVNQENYSGYEFSYFLPGNANSFVIPTKIRYTFYSATGTDGRLGISELFYINNEAVAAYDGLLAPIDKKGNLILGVKNNQSSDGHEDLRIYETRVNEKASLKVGYDSTRSLEIYRPSGQGDIFFKSQQANIGHMRFETNNSSFSFSGGKVGIGTISPGRNLHVKGTETTYIGIDRPNNTFQSGIGFMTNNATIWYNFLQTGGNKLQWYNSSAGDLFTMTEEGRIGIGITTPKTKLEIKNTLANPDALNSQVSNGNLLISDGGNIGMVMGVMPAQNGGYPSYIQTRNNTASNLAYNLLLNPLGGNIGIGTTMPNQKLHVVGYGQFDNGIVGNTAGLLLLGSSSTPLTNSVFLTSGGAMGIGVQNGSFPTGYKLAVAGNVIADKIKVKKSANGAWPDFVFEPNYNLPDLLQIESFVKQNKHLPEIPSTKEIEKDGHDLGEMNRLLLKKVEELTLYMIEMKKENDKLKLRLDRLER